MHHQPACKFGGNYCSIGSNKLKTERQDAWSLPKLRKRTDGSLGTAHAYIDAVAKTGANAFKFNHIAAPKARPANPWRWKFSRQDATPFDYWKRWSSRRAVAWDWLSMRVNVGHLFFSSAFSSEAVELLDESGCRMERGAGETSNCRCSKKWRVRGSL